MNYSEWGPSLWLSRVAVADELSRHGQKAIWHGSQRRSAVAPRLVGIFILSVIVADLQEVGADGREPCKSVQGGVMRLMTCRTNATFWTRRLWSWRTEEKDHPWRSCPHLGTAAQR
jgi:hypothetical protein